MATQPDPLWETVLSLWHFRHQSYGLHYQPWRRQTLARLDRAVLNGLLPLLPGGYYPDFLNPAEGALGFEAGVEAMLSTPKRRLRNEISQVAAISPAPLPSWLTSLGHGDPAALRHLSTLLHGFHRTAVAPQWAQVQAHFDADRAKRSRAFLDGGFHGLLDSFRPLMRWSPPVLEVDFAVDTDVYLNGRGVLLIPSYFSQLTADALADPDLPPVLVYPVEHDLTVMAAHQPKRDGLAPLVGATRAAILTSIETGRTTSELARRIGVSAGAVSQHTSVLRDAGLIRTTRAGKAVLHSLTPLGTAMLEAGH